MVDQEDLIKINQFIGSYSSPTNNLFPWNVFFHTSWSRAKYHRCNSTIYFLTYLRKPVSHDDLPLLKCNTCNEYIHAILWRLDIFLKTISFAEPLQVVFYVTKNKNVQRVCRCSFNVIHKFWKFVYFFYNNFLESQTKMNRL